MPIIALIRIRPSREIVQVYQAIPASMPIPGVGNLSPPVIGWRGGGEITYQNEGGNQVAVEGQPRFGVVEVAPGTIPSGHRVIGTNYTLNQDDSVMQSFVTEPIPTPTPSEMETLVERVGELEQRVAALEGGQ
jgi:hypothetical protein